MCGVRLCAILRASVARGRRLSTHDGEAMGPAESDGPGAGTDSSAFRPFADAVSDPGLEMRAAVWNTGNLHGGLGGADARAAAATADGETRRRAGEKLAFLGDTIGA